MSLKLIETFFDTVSYQNKLPVNYTEKDLSLFQTHLHTHINKIELLQESNVVLLPEIVIVHKGKFWKHVLTNRNLGNRRYVLRLITKYFFRKTKKLSGTYLLVIDDWSNGYYHWLTDVLQRVFITKKYLREAAVILPEKFRLNKYMMESLSLFDARVSFFDPRYNNQIEKLLVPSHAGCSGTFNYTVINGMANFIKTQKSITTLDTTSPEKIYISRSKAGRRRIKNDDAVIGLLEPLGFKTLYMEDYSFTEQVKLLSGCRYLISMHGAGLTNEMFMEAGSSVLEIRHPYDKLNNCYYLMATAIKLNYFYFLSDTDNANPHDADVYVNIALFKECINTFLSFNNA